MVLRVDYKGVLGQAVVDLAMSIKADFIFLISRDEEKSGVKLFLTVIPYRKEEKGYKRMESSSISTRSSSLSGYIKEVLSVKIKEGLLKEGNVVVSIADDTLSTGYLGSMFVSEIKKEFFELEVRDVKVDPNVLDTALQTALELGREGREGRKVGTAFIVGDADKVLSRSHQLVLNPFKGHSEEDRSMLNPNVREIIKEFAQLDGVFVIDGQGIIRAAGRYLDVDITEDLRLPRGLGTRHTAAAAVTADTDAVAIVVSESGGIVRVYHKGDMVLKKR